MSVCARIQVCRALLAAPSEDETLVILDPGLRARDNATPGIPPRNPGRRSYEVDFRSSAIAASNLRYLFWTECNQSKTRSRRLSVIVGSLSLTGQSDKVPPTVLFTPETNGLFRISVDMIITKSKTNKSLVAYREAKLQWMDVKSEVRLGPRVDARVLGSQFQGETYTFTAVAGQPIEFSTKASRAGHSTYDVFVVLEHLGELPSF
jgi:hypothetical protein